MRIASGAGRALAVGAFLLSGCFAHPSFVPVHDNELTFDDYDSTVSYDADSEEELADAPVEVHEFDEAAAAAAGAVKVIDGAAWFNADDFERNDMLNLVQEGEPDGTTFMLCVATGEVWKIPADKFAAVSKIVDPWYGDEYDMLDDYVGQNYAGRQLTLGGFMRVGAVTGQSDFGQIRYLHDFGEIGRREIVGAGGLQVMPRQLWLTSTPQQRSARLDSIDDYLRRLPAFQGAGNAPNFGVTVPWGMVYAVPKAKIDYLIGSAALKAWTNAEIASLPLIGMGTPRWQRGERIIIEPIKP
ncbi:MAG TPA: hypothetical protein VHA35_01825 [Dongiaceae bacterium]|nr:hypothetical protein [Dongiaceae bacterium]